MAKRLLLMKGQVFDPKRHNPAAWYMSEKLDGMRCLWDGGITRGMLPTEVPWANTEKDSRYVKTPLSTGLWTFYGKTIQAPASFLSQLPPFPLDGELWAGRGKFQQVSRIVKQLEPDSRWNEITFIVLDAPSYRELFCDGEIDFKSPVVYKKRFAGVVEWCLERAKTTDPRFLRAGKQFHETVRFLTHEHSDTLQVKVHQQHVLSYNKQEALAAITSQSDQIIGNGGEGIVLRNPSSMWIPARVWNVLKHKPELDDEGVVDGYRWGRETELGSKLLGKMGSMFVSWRGKRFKLSGFTDEERVLLDTTKVGPYIEKVYAAVEKGMKTPDTDVGPEIDNPLFPRGSRVTFKYRELTDDGIPKEARYFRKRDDD